MITPERRPQRAFSLRRGLYLLTPGGKHTVSQLLARFPAIEGLHRVIETPRQDREIISGESGRHATRRAIQGLFRNQMDVRGAPGNASESGRFARSVRSHARVVRNSVAAQRRRAQGGGMGSTRRAGGVTRGRWHSQTELAGRVDASYDVADRSPKSHSIATYIGFETDMGDARCRLVRVAMIADNCNAATSVSQLIILALILDHGSNRHSAVR